MRASPGDRLIIKGHNVGDRDRDAEVLEVRGPDGGPPYVVRWEDTGHETLFFPGSDAHVQHFGAAEAEAVAVAPVVDLIRAEHDELHAGVHLLLDAADALDDVEDGGSLPDVVHESHRFVTGVLLPHARAEESTIYASVDDLVGTPLATRPMRREHEEIDRLIERLGRLRTDAMTGVDASLRRNLRQVLYGLHALLTLHFAVEEEVVVPLLEGRLAARRSAALGEEFLEAQRAATPPTPAVPG